MHSKTGASAAPIDIVRFVFDAPAPKLAEAVVPFELGAVVVLHCAPVAQLAWASTIANGELGLDEVRPALDAVNV